MIGMAERPRAVVVRCVSAAVLALAAALTGVGQEATAAESGPRDTTQRFFYVPLQVTKKTGPHLWLPLSFAYDGPARDAELAVDASGIDGVAVLAPDDEQMLDGCEPRMPSFTCATRLDSEAGGLLKFRPADGARAGDSGVLRYTLTAEGLPTVRGSVTVIAGKPELSVNTSPVTGELPVGETTNVPVLIRNTGDVPTRGVVLRFDDTEDLSTATRHSNCRYPADGETGVSVQCLLPDAVIAPGETMRVTPGLRVRPGRHAAEERLSYGAWPFHTGRGSSIGCCAQNPDSRLTPGNATPLSLTPDPADGKGAAFTTDEEPTSTEVPVRTTADIEAVGASLRGDADGRQLIRVGYRNNGPAHVGIRIVFVVPPGAEVIQLPIDPLGEEELQDEICRTENDGRSYTCGMDGQSHLYEFGLRVTGEDTRSGCVTVSATNGVKDPEPGNNTAPVQVADDGDFTCALPEDDGVRGWVIAIGIAAGIAAVVGSVLLFVRHRRGKASRSGPARTAWWLRHFEGESR
ncbi:hypothetical protein Sipo8835_37455 [Streptomyces ipomoeae]|uniref:DUF11 domain-containing protein n=1 Tax=Streptomyces ipomoeae TaxID=103232 RepID=A0AAE8VXY9_9ACTN|nr:hypothetical protein [Streptomyces ipomoeae]TQE21499.1 hypothetical protein Sipo8835_37455 [Streptomyces ipomoeae]